MVTYCRVSSVERRADLERHGGRVGEECGTRGFTLAATITEIGSGVNGNRVKVTSMCARLYGRRSAVTRADAAVNAAEVAE